MISERTINGTYRIQRSHGIFAIDPKHHAAITSLVAPATSAHRLLDPYAGEGEFLAVAAKQWDVMPYANELDGDRATKCIERFGPKQAVRCDVERLIASNNAFSCGWFNPPYDHDASASGNKRVEFRFSIAGSGFRTADWCCGVCTAHI